MVEGPKVFAKVKRFQTLKLQTLINIHHDNTIKNNNKSVSNDSSTCMMFQNYQICDIYVMGKELFIIFNSHKYGIRLHFGMNGSERITKSNIDINQLMPKNSRKVFNIMIEFSNQYLYLFDTSVTIKTIISINKSMILTQQDVMSQAFNSLLVLELLRYDYRPIYEAIMDQLILPGILYYEIFICI